MATIGVFAIIFDDRQRVLCVRMNYASKNWTTPGGKVEPGESPIEAVKREVFEETGYRVEPKQLIGVYAKLYNDDLVLCFEAEALSRELWEPNHEISEMRYFARDELPKEMTHVVRTRVEDAFNGEKGVVRVFKTPISGSSDHANLNLATGRVRPIPAVRRCHVQGPLTDR